MQQLRASKADLHGRAHLNASSPPARMSWHVQDMVWSVMPWSLTAHGSVRAPLAATAAAFRVAVFLAGSSIAYGVRLSPLHKEPMTVQDDGAFIPVVLVRQDC